MYLSMLLLLMLMTVTAVYAQPEHRVIHTQCNQLKLQFQAKYKNGTEQDQFAFTVDLGSPNEEIFQGFFEYDKGNRTEVSFAFSVKALYEIDVEAYKGNSDNIISKWPSEDNVEWQNWANNSRMVNSVDVLSYSSTTRDGLFTLILSISSQEVLSGKTKLDPNDIKMDFKINYFPYTRNNTRLALWSHTNSQTQSKNNGQGTVAEGMLFFSNPHGAPGGVFSWNSVANTSSVVSNTTVTQAIPVIAWSDSVRGPVSDIFFSFSTDRATRASIFWDPRIGLDYETPFCIGALCGDYAVAVLSLVGAAAIVLLVGTVVYTTKRRRYSEYKVIQ
eukprot:TRINITY_DN16222_c0_g1_i1.p1 TRINITY_DN16222_c0_g1~~TRINITY_DN16222_c0_g1_i1.p1  ORF type:complete len:341 (-),score=35.56 TRINITY_DN16222_c0_g1_i1:194-1186(-)